MNYYWSGYQTEWATDVIFKAPRMLAGIYPALARHAMDHFKSPDVMRFHGGKVHGNFTGRSSSASRTGLRASASSTWWAATPSRCTTRSAASCASRPPSHARTTSRASARPLTSPGASWNGARSAKASPISIGVSSYPSALDSICRGEFATAGFRNRDIRGLIHRLPTDTARRDRRRLPAKTSRQIRLLRAHGVVKKIPKTQRYRLTPNGQLSTAALQANRRANIKALLMAA